MYVVNTRIVIDFVLFFLKRTLSRLPPSLGKILFQNVFPSLSPSVLITTCFYSNLA